MVLELMDHSYKCVESYSMETGHEMPTYQSHLSPLGLKPFMAEHSSCSFVHCELHISGGNSPSVVGWLASRFRPSIKMTNNTFLDLKSM